jgi:hypothetical protein
MNNQSLAGNESNGRPWLGGIGANSGSSSATGTAGLLFVGKLESFARVASSIASSGLGGLFSDQLSDFTGGGAERDPENTGIIER